MERFAGGVHRWVQAGGFSGGQAEIALQSRGQGFDLLGQRFQYFRNGCLDFGGGEGQTLLGFKLEALSLGPVMIEPILGRQAVGIDSAPLATGRRLLEQRGADQRERVDWVACLLYTSRCV